MESRTIFKQLIKKYEKQGAIGQMETCGNEYDWTLLLLLVYNSK